MDLRAVRIRQEGDRVLVLEGGREVFNLPWEAAVEFGRALIEKGRLAEEVAKANLVVMDQAILIRAGMPFGLTNNPDIQSEAVKEAVSNRNLRRWMPGGVKSEEVVGTPRLIQKGPPNVAESGNDDHH